MKVIFLDIDGVLNHEKYYISRCDSDNRPYPLSEFDTDAVERLNEITDVTGAKIVISSSWRFDVGIHNTLKAVGVTGDIIGITKYITKPTDDGYVHVDRGFEIQDFLDSNKYITNYVILDDDTDMLHHQLDNFVHTSYVDGLSESCKRKCINILK